MTQHWRASVLSDIRFAPIPKCASRSLKALGLLGEVGERHHAPIADFPKAERYRWHRVERDPDEWLQSWWQECRRSKDLFAVACGMRFADMRRDLSLLRDASGLRYVRSVSGVNAWVPPDFVTGFARYIETGRHFYDYCVDTITAGFACTPIPLHGLDSWLIERGLSPLHENGHADR